MCIVRIILDGTAFLDGQCIPSDEGFQLAIMKWSSLIPFLGPTYKCGRQEGVETMRIVCKFRSSRLDFLLRDSCT